MIINFTLQNNLIIIEKLFLFQMLELIKMICFNNFEYFKLRFYLNSKIFNILENVK